MELVKRCHAVLLCVEFLAVVHVICYADAEDNAYRCGVFLELCAPCSIAVIDVADARCYHLWFCFIVEGDAIHFRAMILDVLACLCMYCERLCRGSRCYSECGYDGVNLLHMVYNYNNVTLVYVFGLLVLDNLVRLAAVYAYYVHAVLA